MIGTMPETIKTDQPAVCRLLVTNHPEPVEVTTTDAELLADAVAGNRRRCLGWDRLLRGGLVTVTDTSMGLDTALGMVDAARLLDCEVPHV